MLGFAPMLATLDERTAPADPLELFALWYDEAQRVVRPEPTAFVLATATDDGRPSARVLLLKGFEARGFSFYTHYESRKAAELAANPQAAMLFHWQLLERQVRIEGRATRLPAEESDAYFATRPRASRIGAWASPQSRPIADRALLEARVATLAREHEGREVPRPAAWGGFLLEPDVFEFWHAGPDRLHDRLRFDRAASSWSVTRLAP
ncbi:MAG: pyridoxamine 5'-phosphate oxidase [Myxococcales bacterium]|nr:pyridoxamine 5'-phosphate oxidase [Myxococcales bacterium]